eukprot:TRINITY_DN55487_c0_g1_i2.p1 TRINITY_DN55487_c0_g1~~TRINITY_DN55487_c0_g1_i2.p1  ORF type:complete len:413 (-),score=102.36 TRINITY_DN55487_c0_g1_i2:356-1594(-)
MQEPPDPQKSHVHLEATVLESSAASKQQVEEAVKDWLSQTPDGSFVDGFIDFRSHGWLSQNLQSMRVSDLDNGVVPYKQSILHVHPFKLDIDGAAEEEDDEGVAACTQWELPAQEFHGLWESLLYDCGIKSRLLEFSSTALLFADAMVDSTLITWNRVVLLHGPPGTGKTSLAKALAQKLTIRFGQRYLHGELLEINAHSLFSRWFSESGKLVQKLFGKIQELVEDPDVFVCVLIDEVESLTAARKAAIAGSEPSDAIRAVNALLTQIDRLQTKQNVLIIATSNLTEAIDLAFVDRADIKQYIGPPSEMARYEILRSCIEELRRVGLISLAEGETELCAFNDLPTTPTAGCQFLLRTVRTCEGLSGRALRKLPFLAFASQVQEQACSLYSYLGALQAATERELHSRQQLESS